MPQVKSKNTDSWAALIQQHIAPRGHPGKGWLTALEFATKANLSHSHANVALRRMIERGEIQRIRARLDGRPCYYYKPQ